MEWLSEIAEPSKLLSRCLSSERIRFTKTFDLQLVEFVPVRLVVLKQLKLSERREAHDYKKGGEIPCFCFVARETEDCEALTFFVSFGEENDGTVYAWIQEFHP